MTTTVRAITADIPGLEISAAVTRDGTIWLVIGKDAPRPHYAAAEVLEDIIGGLPDRLVLDCTPAPPPRPRLRLVS